MNKQDLEIHDLQKSMIGSRFGGACISQIAFDNPTTDKIFDFLKGNKNFLVFLGGVGIGKTYFCSAIIPWIFKKIPSFRYWNERDMFTRVRKSMDQQGDYLTALDYLLDDYFLILDDMGSCGLNDWRKEIWLHIIDSRYESQKPTVITSNFTRQEIFDKLGFRTHSRMFAKENCVIELHDAHDRRMS